MARSHRLRRGSGAGRHCRFGADHGRFELLALASLELCFVMHEAAKDLPRDEQMHDLRVIATFVGISCFLMASVIRKPIIAMLAGLMLGTVTLAFYFVTGRLPLTFSPSSNFVLLLPASFLLGGFLRTQAWIGPRPRRRQWVPLVPIALSIVPFSIAFYWTNWGGVPEVEPPFDVDEFISNFDNVPESENARRVYFQAIKALPDRGANLNRTTRSKEQQRIYQAYEQLFLSSDFDKTWADDEAAAELYLTECGKTLELCRQATDMKHVEFWSPATGEAGGFDEIDEIRSVAKLMILKARQLHYQGKSQQAAEWLLDVMRMARHVEHHGDEMQSLVATAIDALASGPMVKILAAPEWTAHDLRSVLKDMQTIEAIRVPYDDVVKVGYVGVLSRYKASLEVNAWDGAEQFAEVPPIGSYGLTIVARMEERKTISATNTAFTVLLDAVARAKSEGRFVHLSEQELSRCEKVLARSVAAKFFGPPIHFYVPHYFESQRRRQSRLSLTKTAIALTVWKLEHGRWPDSLEDLVPDLLPELPIDSYAEPAAPLLYRQIPSIGITYVDKHGNVYDAEAAAKANADFDNEYSFSSDFEIRIDDEVAKTAPKIQMLYSRGQDGSDDGGHFPDHFGQFEGSDWLLLLPGESLPPKAPYRRFDSVIGFDPEF